MRLPFLMLTAFLLFEGCIPLNSPGASGNNIYIGNYFFSPAIDSGTADRNDELAVTFWWADSMSGVGHTIVWDSGPPPLPENRPIQFNGTYTVTLTPGRYVYHCSLHEQFFMTGLIIIVPFDTPTASGTESGPHPSPVPALVTRPSPGALQGSPRRAARRSQPATS